MRVGTYNVHKLQGFCADEDVAPLDPEAPATADYFARVIEGLDADVLALQEAASPRQLARIAARLGMQGVTLTSPVRWPGHLLARGEVAVLRDFSSVRAADPSSFTRSGGVVSVQVGGRRLVVVAIHLHPHDADVRAREGDACARMVEELLGGGERALIVLGDFNCDVGEPVHQRLRALGLVAGLPTTVEATVDTAGVGVRRVDHVYLGPAFAAGAGKARVERTPGFRTDRPHQRVASDHLPVLVDLAIPPA
jgi:endonuclease/exonuclease/phosphatase family metal-dependent hydrolase